MNNFFNRTISPALITACALLCMAAGGFAQGLVVQAPRIQGFHPLDQKMHDDNPLVGSRPAVLDMKITVFKQNQDINFEKRQITFSQVDDLGFTIWRYHYPELSEYLAERQKFSFYRSWEERKSATMAAGAERKTLPSLEFALPVEYPAWAQRVLGKDPPKLTITGTVALIVSYDNSRDDKETSVGGKGKSDNFMFNQESNFSIRGSIGRLISVNITANTQDGFGMEDPLKNFKLEYKGEGDELEDEIIQEVVAGYTGFAMPSTQLSGYSESKEGLFGVKVRAKLGPLMLTGILSTERGEASRETKELGGGGGGSGGMTTVRDYQYEKYRFFWLDSAYMRYELKRQLGKLGSTPVPPKIKQFQLWINADKSSITANPTAVHRNAPVDSSSSVPTLFRRLEPNIHYQLSPNGSIMIYDSIRTDESTILGVVLRTEDSTVVPNRGDTTVTDTVSKPVTIKNLWILKAADPDPIANKSTYYLAWTNVYRMPKEIDWATFKINVRGVPPADTTIDYNASAVPFSTVLNLTLADRTVKQGNTDVFRKDEGYLVIPPFDDTTYGFQPFRNPALGDTNPAIYTRRSIELNDTVARYQISMTGSTESRSSTMPLGWGVMSGTELVKADGQKLDRDIDYRIDYQSGTLELTSKRALAAQQVKAEFQREAVFVPESKIFLGFRGEMKLPFISPSSFIGTSLLYQSTSSRDRVPRLGQEPYGKVLLDFNTKLDFEPEWMSKLVYLLPIPKTDVESKIDVEFEAAHSWTRPNTHDSAYVDDFESAKQVFSLGESMNTWFQASPPAWFDTAGGDSTQVLNPPVWNQFWFTPSSDDTRYRIWKIAESYKDKTSQDRTTFESVLHLECKPVPDGPLASQYVNPWAGVMTSIPASFANRENDKYFEFWAADSGAGGKLNIDFGVISEDICISGQPPNGIKNTEDTLGIDIWKNEYDLGLDTAPDSRERWWVPDTAADTFAVWDTARFGGYKVNDSLLDRGDPGRDNWVLYNPDKPGTERTSNRYQNNGGPYFSSEDINVDGVFTIRPLERVFRAVIDLNELNARGFEVAGDTNFFLDNTVKRFVGRDSTNSGNPDRIKNMNWRHYRIPIGSTFMIDSIPGYTGRKPSWKEIRSVRFWWNDFPEATRKQRKVLRLSQIQFTGTQWKEVATVTSSDTTMRVRASTINNFDDQTYKQDIISFDPSLNTTSSNVQKLEQSLRINFDTLKKGEVALVERSFQTQPFNLSLYRSLVVAVHAKDDYRDKKVRFVLRFGADKDAYYEYRSEYIRKEGTKGGWNRYVMDIDTFAQMKLAYLDRETDEVDTIDVLKDIGSAQFGIRAIRRDRRPSFASITWMAIGVIRDTTSEALLTDGEIWVNELKVTGIKPLTGWAARLSVGTQWADFMGVKLAGTFEDGNFRRMTDAIGATENATLEGSLSADWKLDKFLPSSWGVSIPLGASVSGSVSRPQQKPGSDIFLTKKNGKYDGLYDMAEDALSFITGPNDTTESERYERTQLTQSWFTSFDKNTNDKNPLVNLTLDRIAIDYRYNFTKTTEAKGSLPNDSMKDARKMSVFLDTAVSRTYNTTIKYDLSPRSPPTWTKWKPLGTSDMQWIPQRFKEWELTFLPRTIRFDLANADWSKSTTYLSKINKGDDVEKFKLTHGFNFDFTPIDPLLQMGYSLSIGRYLDDEYQQTAKKEIGWEKFLFRRVTAFDTTGWGDYTLLYGERSRTQSATLNLRPQFFEFLTHTADYKADFREEAVGFGRETSTSLNLGVTSAFSLNSSFEWGTLLRNLGDLSQKNKPVNELFDAIQKGSEKFGFRNVMFTYSASNDLKNGYMSREFLDRTNTGRSGFWLYQVGAGGRTPLDMITGGMNDDSAFGGMHQRRLNGDLRERYYNDMRTSQQDYKFSTSLSIPEPIDLSLSSISFGWNRKYTVRPDSNSWDTMYTYPSVGVSASLGFFNKLEFITAQLQSVNVSSQYSLERSRTVKPTTEPDFVLHHTFSPLVSADGTLKVLPVHLQYRFNYELQVRRSIGWTKMEKLGHTFTASYTIEQLTKIPDIKLFGWSFPIKGKTDLSADLDWSHEKRYEKPNAASDKVDEEPTTDILTYSLMPKLSYVFTDNITGTFKYTGKRTSNNKSENIQHAGELRVEIRF